LSRCLRNCRRGGTPETTVWRAGVDASLLDGGYEEEDGGKGGEGDAADKRLVVEDEWRRQREVFGEEEGGKGGEGDTAHEGLVGEGELPLECVMALVQRCR